MVWLAYELIQNTQRGIQDQWIGTKWWSVARESIIRGSIHFLQYQPVWKVNVEQYQGGAMAEWLLFS